MKWNIEPYTSAGPVELGMSHEEVRTAMGAAPLERFVKTPGGPKVDFYPDLGIMAHFENDKCVAVEFYAPAQVSVLGSPVPSSADDAEDWLYDLDDEAEFEEVDWTSRKLGVAFFIDEDRVASVLAFVEGYL